MFSGSRLGFLLLSVLFLATSSHAQNATTTISPMSTSTAPGSASPHPPDGSLGTFYWIIIGFVVFVAVVAICVCPILCRRGVLKPGVEDGDSASRHSSDVVDDDAADTKINRNSSFARGAWKKIAKANRKKQKQQINPIIEAGLVTTQRPHSAKDIDVPNQIVTDWLAQTPTHVETKAKESEVPSKPKSRNLSRTSTLLQLDGVPIVESESEASATAVPEVRVAPAAPARSPLARSPARSPQPESLRWEPLQDFFRRDGPTTKLQNERTIPPKPLNPKDQARNQLEFHVAVHEMVEMECGAPSQRCTDWLGTAPSAQDHRTPQPERSPFEAPLISVTNGESQLQ